MVTCPADSKRHKTCKERDIGKRWNKSKLRKNHVQQTPGDLQFFIILRLGIIIYPRDSTKNLGDIEPATLKIMTNTIFSRHHLHHIGTTSHLIPPTLTTTGISPAATTGSDDKDLPGHEEGREVSFIHQGDHHDCDNEYDDKVLSL